MFNLREFIKKGFLDAVGKMADYQIILNATGYYEKCVLLEEDLAEINEAIEKQYAEITAESVENSAEVLDTIEPEIIESEE